MVYIAAIKDSHDLLPSLYESLLAFVSDSRKRRAKKLIRREDACRSIVGEVLAQYCVGKAARIPAKTVTFHVDSFGKPHANLERQIHFNVSHSKSWVVCAVDRGPIGIDVEYMREFDPDVAKRFFHPHEYAALAALPEKRRNDRFYELWTIKESYVKALGKGLSLPLDGFEVLFENGAIRMKTLSENPVMHFRQYDVGLDYRCAACSGHEGFPKELDVMTPEELLENVKVHGIS
jgi:4'-phosphopantetheinyl transferase